MPEPDEPGRVLMELLTLNRFVDAQRYLEAHFRLAPDHARQAIDTLAKLPRTRPFTDDEILKAIDLVSKAMELVSAKGIRPAAVPPTGDVARAAASSSRALSLTGCLAVVLVIGACIGLLCLMSMGSWTVSGAYRQALARTQASASVREALGSPVNPEFGFWTGTAGYGTRWEAAFGVPISGSKRKGMMQVRADTRGSYFDENWNVRVTVNFDDGQRVQSIAVP